jgi:phosphoribosyl-ATP pyrophosphohydrolase
MNTNINFLIQKIKKSKLKKPNISYTSFLIKKGPKYCLKKIKEETLEFISAIKNNKNKKHIIHEGADLIYHLLVLLELRQVDFLKIIKELKRRTKFSGITEKNNRKNVRQK